MATVAVGTLRSRGRGGLRDGHRALQALASWWTSSLGAGPAAARLHMTVRSVPYAVRLTPVHPAFNRTTAGAGAGGAPWTFVRWAGHNKWSKIFRDKAVNDQKRSQAFTKVAKEIVAAVKGAASGRPT